MPDKAQKSLTIINWNIGGAKYLDLRSIARAGEQSRKQFRKRLNCALDRLVREHDPDIVTLQEIVHYRADRNAPLELVIDVPQGYSFYPNWLVNTDDHSAQRKWTNAIRLGGWAREALFGQGNAILIRKKLRLHRIWSIPKATVGSDSNPKPTAPSSPVGNPAEHFIEVVPLQPGLYFGNRDTEARAAAVAHLVMSDGEDRADDSPLDVFVINLHLTTLTNEREGIPEVDRRAEVTRLRQLDIVLEQIVSSYNRWAREGFPIRGEHVTPGENETHHRYAPLWIIAGDFNFTPESIEYSTMLRRGFLDMISPAQRDAPIRRRHTKASGEAKDPTHTLDYIFAGPCFDAISPAVADQCGDNTVLLPGQGDNQQWLRVSDHYPLKFEIPIGANPARKCAKCG